MTNITMIRLALILILFNKIAFGQLSEGGGKSGSGTGTFSGDATSIRGIPVISPFTCPDGGALVYVTGNSRMECLAVSATVAWGQITGTLASQTDIQSALNGKASSVHTHATGDITTGTMADARISASSVTQHQSALSLSGTQITSGTIPGARLPAPAAGTFGGVRSLTCPGTDKLSAIGTDGIPVCTADQNSGGGGGGTYTFSGGLVELAGSNVVVDTTQVVFYAIGSGAPTAPCTAGGMFYTRIDVASLYGCGPTDNTWYQVGGTTGSTFTTNFGYLLPFGGYNTCVSVIVPSTTTGRIGQFVPQVTGTYTRISITIAGTGVGAGGAYVAAIYDSSGNRIVQGNTGGTAVAASNYRIITVSSFTLTAGNVYYVVVGSDTAAATLCHNDQWNSTGIIGPLNDGTFKRMGITPAATLSGTGSGLSSAATITLANVTADGTAGNNRPPIVVLLP